MLSKIFAFTAAILVFSAQVHAHAAVAPALGVSGTPTRNDVQNPSTASPCGKIDIASALSTSTPVVAAANGSFVVTAIDYNGGADGSRKFTALVNSDATGKSFVDATVLQNGDPAPANSGSEQLVVSIPTGTKCSGGPSKNLCVYSFKSTAGFGNCVVVQQAASIGNTATVSTTGGTGTGNSSTTGKTCSKTNSANTQVQQYGTRAPRARLAELAA